MIAMDRPLLKASRMRVLRFSLAAGISLVSIACGGEPDGLVDDSAGEVVCPLDAGARAEVERVIDDALFEASWIATQSPGAKAPVQRAFGAQIPFASAASLFLVEVVDDCSGPAELSKQCPGSSDAKVAAPAVCTQFACEEDGTLVAEVSLGAAPAAMPASPGPGQVVIAALEHATRYKLEGDHDLAIAWSTRIDLEAASGRELALTTLGEASMDGGILLNYHLDVEAEGFGDEKFTAVSDYDGSALNGMGSVGDTPVMLFDTFGFSWIGPCTPGISD